MGIGIMKEIVELDGERGGALIGKGRGVRLREGLGLCVCVVSNLSLNGRFKYNDCYIMNKPTVKARIKK